jgi:hypothetical protein
MGESHVQEFVDVYFAVAYLFFQSLNHAVFRFAPAVRVGRVPADSAAM